LVFAFVVDGSARAHLPFARRPKQEKAAGFRLPRIILRPIPPIQPLQLNGKFPN
jgi:hypothetical protein